MSTASTRSRNSDNRQPLPNIENNDDYPEEYFGSERIHIPEVESNGFSFRKLWAFMGPGFIMSIAYLDPGNIESDLRSGTVAEYRLLWVLLSATVLGLFMQRLSARLGVVSGLHLAEMCYRQYKKMPRLLVWIMMEICIIGSDMQEVIGTAIAIYILSNRTIPLWAGVLITIVDTFTFLLLDKYGLRKLELLFAVLITVMAVTFGFEFVLQSPDGIGIAEGIFIPWCEKCDKEALVQAVGIIGAIGPYNLYLHSALVKSRDIDRKNDKKVKDANLYFFIEAALAVLISFFINVFVASVFAKGLFEKTNKEIRSTCKTSQYVNGSIFPDNDDFVSADLYKAGIFLGCSFGTYALYIWALGLLAAGQSSTMTGTYAGQFAMEGFLNLKWSRWRRILLTRTIAIIPTFCLAFFTHIEDLTSLNDFLNTVMSIQLPFATIPVIAFTSDVNIMGEFANGRIVKLVAALLNFLVIGINVYFAINFIGGFDLTPYQILPFGILGVLYLILCTYLLIHMFVSMGASWFTKFKFIEKYVMGIESGQMMVSY